MSIRTIILTGGAGFIGSNFLHTVALDPAVKKEYEFHILDSLTYAGEFSRIEGLLASHPHLHFYKQDICDLEGLKKLFAKIQPEGVLHYAAESHVDNSIKNPLVFVETNVVGTTALLNASLDMFKQNKNFRFVHVSTDEVYGSLEENEPAFTEENLFKPNSPYSASKASSDLMCRAFFETFKLPVMITRCSNNYGPRQHKEKLIPLMITKAKSGAQLPVYGNGKNIRDWIHVDDHNLGIWSVFLQGKAGEAYNFGGNTELRNIDIVKMIVELTGAKESQISYVTDRLGHDWRYAMNYTKATIELGWTPKKVFKTELVNLISHYSI